MSSSGAIISEEAKNFVKVVKEFFKPLVKRPLSFFVWPIIIIIVSQLYVATGVGELARNNADDALFLAADAFTLGAEPISKLGPDFTEENKSHAEMLAIYSDQKEERHLAAILSLLHPDYEKQKKRLIALSSTLKNAPTDKEQAREAIWRAGKELNEFYKDSEKLSAKKIIWFKYERIPEELVRDLDKALAESETRVKELEENLTVENALAACQANRRTMLLLFLARMGYGSQEKINQFLSITEKTLDCKSKLAEKIEDPEVKQTVLTWRDGEERRVDILNAMLDNDMEKVRNLLKEAIEKAFADKHIESVK